MRKVKKYIPAVSRKREETVFERKQIVKDGIVLNTLQVTSDSPAARCAAFRASDFALENRIAVGALDGAVPLSYGAPQSVQDSIAATSDVISSKLSSELSDEGSNN